MRMTFFRLGELMQRKWNYLCLKSTDGVFAFSFGSNWFGLDMFRLPMGQVLINHFGLFMGELGDGAAVRGVEGLICIWHPLPIADGTKGYLEYTNYLIS